MYIGEKSDLFQLGMTLWGLAADDDEPERHDPPLLVDQLPDEVPLWYKEIVGIRTKSWNIVIPDSLYSEPKLRLREKEAYHYTVCSFGGSDQSKTNRSPEL